MKVYFINTKILPRILGLIYVSGILFMGLWQNPFKCTQYKILLDVRAFSWQDFTINTMGFIPLGYLLMLSFGNPRKDQRSTLFKRAIIAAVVGVLISLFLEVSQYYLILGRHSSLFDCIANTLGTLAGIVIYLVKDQIRVAHN